jgi:hypothetical protein
MVRSLILSFALAAAGCSVISSDTAAENPQNALTVQVSSAPPPEKTENAAKPDKPDTSRPYLWVAGYWDYIAGNYVWKDGHWVEARPDYEYVRARYEFDGKAWIFHKPHWKRRHAASSAT